MLFGQFFPGAGRFLALAPSFFTLKTTCPLIVLLLLLHENMGTRFKEMRRVVIVEKHTAIYDPGF